MAKYTAQYIRIAIDSSILIENKKNSRFKKQNDDTPILT